MSSAHGVCSSLLSVEWPGNVKNPRVPIDNEKPFGSLISTCSADLIGYGHFVVIAGLDLKETSLKMGLQKQIHLGKASDQTNPRLPSPQI